MFPSFAKICNIIHPEHGQIKSFFECVCVDKLSKASYAKLVSLRKIILFMFFNLGKTHYNSKYNLHTSRRKWYGAAYG
jgi:hypothetical protein